MAITFHANGRIEGTGSTTPYVVGSICQSKKFSITAPSTISATLRQGHPSGIKCSITPISTSPKILIVSYVCYSTSGFNAAYTLRDNTAGTFIQFNPGSSPVDPGIGSPASNGKTKITSGGVGSVGFNNGNHFGCSARTYVGEYTPPNNSTREIEVYMIGINNNGTIYVGRNRSDDNATYDSYSPCELTLMEIAG
mgnify:CR=1 FL=1